MIVSYEVSNVDLLLLVDCASGGLLSCIRSQWKQEPVGIIGT